MPASMATKLGIQFARFAQYTAASAATNNAGTHGLRGAFASSSGPAPAFAPGVSSSSSATGIGGAKFQAGKGAHSSFQNSGRTLANANGSSANDGNTSISDDEEDRAFLSTQGPAKIHRPFFQERRESIFQHGLRSRMIEATSTIHLILPTSPRRNVCGARSISSSASQELPVLTSFASPSAAAIEDAAGQSRSLSTSASQAQEIVEAETRASSPLPPPDRISIEQHDSSVVLAKYNLEEPAAKALERLFSARHSSRNQVKRSSIAVYQQSPKDHFSTPAFNAAMQLAIELKDDKSTQNVLDLYQQMIDANYLPDRKTYAHLVRALCEADSEQYRYNDDEESASPASDAHYQQALAFIEVVHASSHGFDSVHPYNHVLRSCAIRGDAENACGIIDKLSANKYVTPTASTFTQLLDAFRRSKNEGSTPAEVQEINARKLQSCEHIFNEFEVFRSSIGWESKYMQEAAVWGVMISTYFQLGSADKAIALVQKMMDGEPLSDGKKAAPRPFKGTTKTIILSLVRLGDIEGAMSWFERILALNNDVEEGQQSLMPPPDSTTIRALFRSLMHKLPFGTSKSSVDDATLLAHLPMVTSTNRILSVVYDNKQQYMEDMIDDTSEEIVELRNGEWRMMLAINSDYGSRLIEEGHLAEASALSDLSLSHIKRHYELYAGQLSYASLVEKGPSMRAEQVTRLRRSVRALLQVTELLLQQDRFHDAAACFSYAIATCPADEWQVKGIQVPFDELGAASLAIMGFMKTVEKANINYATHWELKPEANIKVHAHVALTYILPAVQQRMNLPIFVKRAAKKLYLAARQQQIEATELNLDVRGWSYLLECLISEGFGKTGIDIGFLEVLVNDLEALSEADRDQLSLQIMIANLPGMVGQEKAREYLQRIRPALQAELVEAAPMQEAAESSIGSVTEEHGQLSATEAPSPTTTQTSMASPETTSEYNASLSYALPPIVTIDADLGSSLVQEARMLTQRKKGLRGGTGPAERLGAARLDPLYKRLTSSIQELGTYSTPDGICELMNQYGRSGALEKVKELYLIGQHVVSALGGDPSWQMQSWYELEDTMTAALAHGGDHRLANAHRIALLQGGRAPKADTYAALITTIRDTTDDVMVAEELFDESQRMGIPPTLYLFNTVLSKLSRARKADRAMQLFDELRSRGVQPSSITYGAVLNACTRTGDEANAERFFAMMESDAQFRPKAPPYNTMLQFYTQTKPDRQKALFYYEKALKRNVEHTSHTYKLLLDVYGSIEPIDEAGMRTIFGKLIADYKVDVQGNHWASLIWAYGSHLKDLDKAIEIYQSISTHPATIRAGNRGQEPDALAFEALLGVFADHRRIDLIEEQLRKREEKGCELTAYVANVVIKAYATQVPEIGLERARQVFEMMKDPPVGMAAAGNHPLQRQHVSGVQHGEQSPFDEANHAQLAGFERLKREPSTFEAMIRAEMEHGNLQEATALIQRMQARGYPPIVVTHAHDIIVQQPVKSAPEAVEQ